ncbi:MAG: fused MFS/spermidine synthase [bacterium]
MKEPQSHQPLFIFKISGGVVLISFFLSGAVGLIYEILWSRLLRLVMGNTVFSITTVLCAFMGGLALGSYLGGKLIDRRDDPLRIYALLQGAIGIYSLFLPGIIKSIDVVYIFIYQNYHTSFYLFSLLRFFICCMVLLVPTTLMGATLPILTKYFVRGPDRIGWTIGKLYSVNTFGAVIGSFIAGFVLIPIVGVHTTLYIAVMINVFIWVLIYSLHYIMRQEHEEMGWDNVGIESRGERLPKIVLSERMGNIFLLGYGLSGCAALVYEIAWTRILTLIIGSSVYSFSLMLTAFILGLALGSILFARFIDQRQDLVLFLGIIEIMIGFSAFLIVPFFGRLPVLIVDMIAQFSHSFWLLQSAEFALIFLLMLVPTTLMGAAFPLATRIYTRSVDMIGSCVGSIYAINTFGSIIGSFGGAFILIPLMGIRNTILVAAFINIIIGCAFLGMSHMMSRLKKGMIAALVLIAISGCALSFPRWDVDLISSGPFLSPRLGQRTKISGSSFENVRKNIKILYHKEGISTTITVKESPDGHRFLLINGKGDASSSEDMPTQELLAHIPMLLHPHPQKVCVIGLASGVTLGSSALYSTERLDCVEISPEAVEASHYFDHINYKVLEDSRVELIIEDGRNHLALTDRDYDVIISEPSNPWMAGIADLFTQEYFQLCRQKLTPHGVACIWLNAYSIEDKTFRSIIHTFRTVFPSCMVWEPWLGVDYLLIGSKEKITLEYGHLCAKLWDERIRADLSRINITDAIDFLGHFIMDEEGIRAYMEGHDFQIHTDDNAFVEFSTPKALYGVNTKIELIEALNRHRDKNPSFLLYSGVDDKNRNMIKSRIERLIHTKQHIINGKIFLARGSENEAIDAFEKALSPDPAELSTVEKYGEFLTTIYLRHGEYGKAMRVLEKQMAIIPDNTRAMTKMGKLYIRMNALQKAEQLFQQVLTIDPKCAEAYLHAGYLHLLKRDPQQALSLFITLVRLQPENAQAYLYLGKTYQALGQIEEALGAWQTSIDLEPTLKVAHLDLGNTYFEMGDLEKAQQEWQQGLEDGRAGILTHLVNLGTLYFQSGNYERAMNAWRMAGDLKMDDPQIHYNIALAYYQQGSFQSALRELKESIRVKPDHKPARILMERIETERRENEYPSISD